MQFRCQRFRIDGNGLLARVGSVERFTVPVELRGDLHELVLGELLAQDETPVVLRTAEGVGVFEGLGAFLLIEHMEGGGIVHLRDGVQVLPLHIVGERQRRQRERSDDRTDQDERRAPSEAGLVPVGDRAEQRQHKQRKDIVERHHQSRGRLRQTELVGQDQGDRVVVGLPESADQEEGKPDVDRAFVVQFHCVLSPMISFSNARMLS